MFPILIKLGPLTLHTYGLLVAFGFLAAYTLFRRRLQQKGLPLNFIDNLAFLILAGGLLGARLLFFMVDPSVNFMGDPLSFFRLWEGGLVYYGGFLGALIVLAIVARRNRVPFLLISDAGAAPLLVGQAIGRLGCFTAGCCYGRSTDGPFGVVFSHPESLAPLGMAIHPTQLYESIGNAVLCCLLLYVERKTRQIGLSTAAYFIGYGLFRFFIESLRADDRGIQLAGLYPSQVISLAAVVAGISLLIYATRPKTV